MTARLSLSRLLGATLIASTLVLAGCYGRVRSGGEAVANVPQQYDMTLEAAKDGQFLLDGGMLSADDLGGHFQYLKDQKQLPKTVLLKDGPDANVKDQQLEYFAGLQLSFGFTGYVEHKGKLQLLSAVQDKDEPASAGSSQ